MTRLLQFLIPALSLLIAGAMIAEYTLYPPLPESDPRHIHIGNLPGALAFYLPLWLGECLVLGFLLWPKPVPSPLQPAIAFAMVTADSIVALMLSLDGGGVPVLHLVGVYLWLIPTFLRLVQLLRRPRPAPVSTRHSPGKH